MMIENKIKNQVDQIFRSLLDKVMRESDMVKDFTIQQKLLISEGLEYNFNIRLDDEDIKKLFSWNYAYLLKYLETYLRPFGI